MIKSGSHIIFSSLSLCCLKSWNHTQHSAHRHKVRSRGKECDDSAAEKKWTACWVHIIRIYGMGQYQICINWYRSSSLPNSWRVQFRDVTTRSTRCWELFWSVTRTPGASAAQKGASILSKSSVWPAFLEEIEIQEIEIVSRQSVHKRKRVRSTDQATEQATRDHLCRLIIVAHSVFISMIIDGLWSLKCLWFMILSFHDQLKIFQQISQPLSIIIPTFQVHE